MTILDENKLYFMADVIHKVFHLAYLATPKSEEHYQSEYQFQETRNELNSIVHDKFDLIAGHTSTYKILQFHNAIHVFTGIDQTLQLIDVPFSLEEAELKQPELLSKMKLILADFIANRLPYDIGATKQ